ncbi:MAG: hypothetical protein QJR08_04535 [Bacillota bacterium]|nr:hypothetical protein [Bacillota bacterium]
MFRFPRRRNHPAESLRCVLCQEAVPVEPLPPSPGRGQREAVCPRCGALYRQAYGWDRQGFWQGPWKLVHE